MPQACRSEWQPATLHRDSIAGIGHPFWRLGRTRREGLLDMTDGEPQVKQQAATNLVGITTADRSPGDDAGRALRVRAE